MNKEAKRLNDAGLRVIPVGTDKRPTVKWKKYIRSQDANEIYQIFNSKTPGMAMICGEGIEALDFDLKNEDTAGAISKFKQFLSGYPTMKSVLKSLVWQKTPSGGFHAVYKCTKIEGNKKLLMNPMGEALIETRGEGGYIVICPTPGYEITNGDFAEIPLITEVQRDILHLAAEISGPPPVRHEKRKESELIEGAPYSWRVYDTKSDFLEVLHGVGWTYHSENNDWVYYTRPYSKSGDIHAAYSKDENFFYVFTTSDRHLDGPKGYPPSAVYAHVVCGGDFTLAGKQLFTLGYGSVPGEDVVPPDEDDRLYIKFISTRFSVGMKINEIDYCYKAIVNDKIYNIADYGHMGFISGYAKSRKTLYMRGMIASSMTRKTYLNALVNVGNKNVLHIDTEQPLERWKMGEKHIYRMAGIEKDLPNFYSYYLRWLKDPLKRRDIVLRSMHSMDNCGVVFLDGVVDLVRNYNDLEESRSLMDDLMEVTASKNLLLINVLHLADTSGRMKGHLGAFARQKCDFNIEISLNEDGFSTAKCRLSRDLPFPQFDFTHGEDGLPVLCNEEEGGGFRVITPFWDQS